jgi:hypothetical protein
MLVIPSVVTAGMKRICMFTRYVFVALTVYVCGLRLKNVVAFVE